MYRATLPSLVLSLLLTACMESREMLYEDREAAVHDGAIVRGWLPEWLPASATDIYSWHNVDTKHLARGFFVLAG